MLYLNRSIIFVVIAFFLLCFLIMSCNRETGKITTLPDKNTSETSSLIQPFGHDYYAANVNIGDDERDLQRVLGSPTEKNVQKCEHSGYCGTFIYPFGKFELEGQKAGYLSVVRIIVSSSGFYGPRKTQVGDDIDSVIKKFPHENHQMQNKQRKLYGDMNKIYELKSNKVRWEDLGYGVVNYDDQGEIVEVIYSDDGGGRFGGHLLTFKVKNGRVSEINLFVQSV